MRGIAHGMKPRKGGPSKAVARQFVKDADDGGKQLDNTPVIFQKKPVAQARKRVRKAR